MRQFAFFRFLIGLAALFAASAAAFAGEQVIEFRYVIHPLEVKTFEAPNIEGQTMVMGKVFGVVAFKDGRVGTKDFIYQAELLNGDGPIHGFSTYRFEDGSSITASFAGEIKGGQRHGTSHGLSSAFLAFQAGIEQRAVFEHGAGDVEKTVADGAQSTGVAATAGLQSKVLGFARLIAPPGGVSQVVNGVPQSWIAGEPSGDGAAFA